ncbi:hypothetical protein HY612_01990 [Candidatus Roizmanbacteria bacterium]|nr:hypothetical protein [Candidatus Roizmanbacteria bacterium]
MTDEQNKDTAATDKQEASTADQSSDAPDKVDLSSLSKRPLVEEIERNKDRYLSLISVTEEEKANASACPMKAVGFENNPYIAGDELQAVLIKFLPRHLLENFQHAKKIVYFNKALRPKSTAKGTIEDEELTPEAAEREYIRTLAIKVHDEPFIRLFSPAGMSSERDVLRIALVQATIHDIAHGIWDYHFDLAQSDNETVSQAALEWLNDLQELAYSGPAVSAKSQVYSDESAERGKDFGQEELAEMVRMYVFEHDRFKSSATNGLGGHNKYEYTQALFTQGNYRGHSVLPAVLPVS